MTNYQAGDWPRRSQTGFHDFIQIGNSCSRFNHKPGVYADRQFSSTRVFLEYFHFCGGRYFG